MGFDFSLVSLTNANFFAFCVMVWLLVLLCKKLRVAEKIETNRAKIADQVEMSEQVKLQAIENLKVKTDDFENLPSEIQALNDTAKNSGEILARNILQEAENKTQIIDSNILRAVDYEVKNKKIALTKEVSNASLKLAYDNISELLETNPNLHHEIINECINEL